MDFGQYNIVNERPRTMRALARQALQGRWREAFVFLLVVAAIRQVPVSILDHISTTGIIGFISQIYDLLIAGPMAVSTAYYFIKLFRQRSGGLEDVKYGFSFAQKAIVLNLLMYIKIFLWTLLFIVPGIIAGLRYSMANYILADDPSKSPQQCIAESSWMMRGNKMNYVILMLSFIGWLLLASIPSGLTEFAVAPRDIINFTGSTDPTQYINDIASAASHPLVLITSIPTLLVTVYMNTATACFYDLANGNLSVGGYDYAGAAGSVQDPFTGQDVTFTDVPAEVVPQELPEKFEDPELKAAEEKYTGNGDDNIYGE